MMNQQRPRPAGVGRVSGDAGYVWIAGARKRNANGEDYHEIIIGKNRQKTLDRGQSGQSYILQKRERWVHPAGATPQLRWALYVWVNHIARAEDDLARIIEEAGFNYSTRGTVFNDRGAADNAMLNKETCRSLLERCALADHSRDGAPPPEVREKGFVMSINDERYEVIGLPRLNQDDNNSANTGGTISSSNRIESDLSADFVGLEIVELVDIIGGRDEVKELIEQNRGKFVLIAHCIDICQFCLPAARNLRALARDFQEDVQFARLIGTHSPANGDYITDKGITCVRLHIYDRDGRLDNDDMPSDLEHLRHELNVYTAEEEEYNSDSDEEQNPEEENFLVACSVGLLATARRCLQRGADANCSDNDRYTPLMYACYASNLMLVNLLLGEGAEVNARNNSGQNALFIAACGNSSRIVKALIEAGAEDDGIMAHACDYDFTIPIVIELMKGLFNVDAHPAVSQRTALMDAARSGNTDLARLFIDGIYGRRADINRKDAVGYTALMHAVEWGHFDMVEILLSKGANVHLQANNGSTAFSLAQEAPEGRRDQKIIEALQEAAALPPPIVQPAERAVDLTSPNEKVPEEDLQKITVDGLRNILKWYKAQENVHVNVGRDVLKAALVEQLCNLEPTFGKLAQIDKALYNSPIPSIWLESYRLDQLQEICRFKNLPSAGTREELVHRLKSVTVKFREMKMASQNTILHNPRTYVSNLHNVRYFEEAARGDGEFSVGNRHYQVA